MLSLNHLPCHTASLQKPFRGSPGPTNREKVLLSFSPPHFPCLGTPTLHHCPLTHLYRNNSSNTFSRIWDLERPVPKYICVGGASARDIHDLYTHASVTHSPLQTFSCPCPNYSSFSSPSVPRAKLLPEWVDRMKI